MTNRSNSPTATSNRSQSLIDTLTHADWEKVLTRTASLIFRPMIEIAHGVRAGTLPWGECLACGLVAGGSIVTHLDLAIARKIHLDFLYPYSPYFYWTYCGFALTSGFWLWGLRETAMRNRLINRLTETCTNAGLKSPLGQLPKFVFDRPLDDFTRKMRLNRAGLALAQFQKAKSTLESCLQVYIDDIRENRAAGTVDLIYAHCPMPEYVPMEQAKSVPKDSFVVGKTRANWVTVSLKDVPHLLIAGQTGGGKSTFLREMIAMLYRNNPQLEFTLVDLKGGLEFQIFDGLNRVRVVPDIERAVAALARIKGTLEDRMILLRKHECKDIDALGKLRDKLRAEGKAEENPVLNRHILVIDEAAEIFLAGAGSRASNVQTARSILSQIARQGRAVGIHLVVATQRPDSRALDPQVKANLVGVLCFQMLNDSSSITVLGVGRASDLPPIPGRAIWKYGAEMLEVQVPYLSEEDAKELLKGNTAQTETKTLPQPIPLSIPSVAPIDPSVSPPQESK